MDKYDKEIQELTEIPEDILGNWCSSSPLFSYVEPNNKPDSLTPEQLRCGCLVMIRSDVEHHAWTPELTAAIRADSRIPTRATAIKPEHLPIFAYWQRRIDKELGRH